jgi:translation initiation factor IF-3
LIDKRKPISNSPRLKINGFIRAREVRVIGVDGQQLGVLQIRDALVKAHEAGLDLVEVAPTANPPVCRVMDFGKYKYEQNKKEHSAKSHQKAVQIKEVQFRPFISGHDLDFKVRHAKEFLEAKQKVKITLLFRGRELSLQDKGRDIMMGIVEQLKEIGSEENPLKKEGRNFVMVMAPKSTKEKVSHPEKEDK